MIYRITRYAFIIFFALVISCRQNSSQSGKLSDSAKTNAANARGFLHKDGQTLFPIGFYELPGEEAELQRYVRSGINLFRCSGKADLDRVAAAGALGWVPLGLTAGENEDLKSKIASIVDHPALAVWEGPDEIVHSFTRWSGLYRTLHVYKSRDEWEQQTPNAIAYSEKKAREIMPAMHKAIEMIRRMDSRNRPVWINEATNSDLKFVRQYVDAIDITGADSYPVKESERDVAVIGDITERWKKVGRNQKAVWMVLQAFSWNELGDYFGAKKSAYPSFIESRFMAYDAIVHGAGGLLYWGSHYLHNPGFRQSILALTGELAALQPFLVAPDQPVHVELVECVHKIKDRGVQVMARRHGDDWIIVLVNEDRRPHLGIEITGIDDLNGRDLQLLYGDEKFHVERGELITRLTPLQVKVFATGRQWQSQQLKADLKGL